MHKKARGNLSSTPYKNDVGDDVIERIRQIEATAISRGGLPASMGTDNVTQQVFNSSFFLEEIESK